MIFANPKAWYLLLCLPLIAAALHFFYLHRCRMTSLFIQEHLQDELAQGFNKKHYRLKALLITGAFFFIVVALSRPQWGYHERQVKRHGLDIMVVIDVSKSMLTQDVKPSRLERTKLAVRDLVMKLSGSDHIGLIAFAGDAQVMCPLTYDYNGFLLALDDLSTDTIPRGGTDISQAIDESIKAYQGLEDSDKAVVLVTDGEDEEGDALTAARRAHEKGVRIFTVGVGTREGDLIQLINADGSTEFQKDSDGNVVKSHLNENLLQQIAYITEGAYIHSGATHFGLDYLYDRQLSKLKKHDAEAKMAKLYNERFQWPLTLALVLLLIETLISRRKKTSVAFSILFIFFLFNFFLTSTSFASVAGKVNKANVLYKHGQFDDSLKLYQDALDMDDSSPVVKYDLGTAYYKKGDYAKALGYLEQAAEDKNIKIKPKAEYNLGNTLYKVGIQKENTNVNEAIKSLQEALGHYSESIAADPKDQDAAYNEDFVKKEIERLKQIKHQQQQQQQQQQQKDQQNKQGSSQSSQQQQGQQQKQDQQQGHSQKQQPAQEQSDASKKVQKKKDAEAQAQEDQKDIDRKQAEDMLEDYQENEEPKKLLNYVPKKIDDRPVLKDW